jgi:hypothetical protein
VLVAGPQSADAAAAFEAAGFDRLAVDTVDYTGAERDVMVRLELEVAAKLREADRQGIRYILVHVGPDDGEPGGSFARAHHLVEPAALPELAVSLRTRRRILVACLAFGFRGGIPAGSGWVVDARCLDNPYWIEELRELDGRSQAVRDYVLRQPEALVLLDGLEATLRQLIPAYRRRGRNELTVAFGCTGGRHRSVVLAEEMARRLSDLEDVDVESRSRELD